MSLASKSTWGGARLTLLLHSAPPLLGPRCQQHRRHENPPLGSYEQEEHAAEAFDVAAMKCKAGKVRLNYPVGKYADLIPLMQSCSLDELVMAVRRRPALRGRVGSGGGRGSRAVTHGTPLSFRRRRFAARARALREGRARTGE